MPTTDTLSVQLDRIAALDSGPYPVVSLYLNLQPDQHGRDNFESFLRKALADRLRTYGMDGPERHSLEQDAARIRTYMESADRAANGLALFACSGAGFFETIELAAPIAEHRLFISDQPHLYPLARVIDDYPRYAVLLADTNAARIVLIAANSVVQTEQIEGTKTRRHKMGGWSQARYQRHVDNYHLHHAKEVVDTLARIVADEAIPSVIVAGDDVIVPLLKAHMTKELSDKVVDVMKLDIRAPAHKILASTRAMMQEKDAQTDREHVDALLGAYRANGLAVVGADDVRTALERGQVDELMITGTLDMIEPGVGEGVDPGTSAAASAAGSAHTAAGQPSTGTPSARSADRTAEERTADDLMLKARQTAAKIRIVQDASLLAAVGGVGAFLRFKL
jgi:peptide chain release factor subunit 1